MFQVALELPSMSKQLLYLFGGRRLAGSQQQPHHQQYGEDVFEMVLFSCLFFLFIFALYFQLAKPSYFDKRFPAIQALGLAGLDGKDPTNRINITVNI